MQVILLEFSILRPRQDGRHFSSDMCKYIFLKENIKISIENSQKDVLKGSINNIKALVQFDWFTDTYMRRVSYDNLACWELINS